MRSQFSESWRFNTGVKEMYDEGNEHQTVNWRENQTSNLRGWKCLLSL